MPEPLKNVEAGDLITADNFNALIDKVNELATRLEDLESGQGGVVINGFDPPGEVEVGQAMAILGANFAYPPNQNTVTIDSHEIQEFLVGSTNTTLRLRVPGDIQVSQGGRNVAVQVRNDEGETAQRSYRLLPASADQPSITSVTRSGSTSSNLIIGQPAVIEGENFGPTREDNIIEFIASQNVFPDDQSDLTVHSVSENRIVVVVPEIPMVLPFLSLTVLLRITVDGLTATRQVNVRRQ